MQQKQGDVPALTQPTLPADEDFVPGPRRLPQADVALGLLPRDAGYGIRMAGSEMHGAQPHPCTTACSTRLLRPALL